MRFLLFAELVRCRSSLVLQATAAAPGELKQLSQAVKLTCNQTVFGAAPSNSTARAAADFACMWSNLTLPNAPALSSSLPAAFPALQLPRRPELDRRDPRVPSPQQPQPLLDPYPPWKPPETAADAQPPKSQAAVNNGSLLLLPVLPSDAASILLPSYSCPISVLPADDFPRARHSFAATVLDDGSVAIAGGAYYSFVCDSSLS